jgi:hypothetical protein
METFESSCVAIKPVPIHLCCDFCSNSCSYEDCVCDRALTESYNDPGLEYTP